MFREALKLSVSPVAVLGLMIMKNARDCVAGHNIRKDGDAGE